MVKIKQADQLKNPDARILFAPIDLSARLNEYAIVAEGLHTGDYPRFGRKYWELPSINRGWAFQQGGSDDHGGGGGCEHVIFWEDGNGVLMDFVKTRLKSEVTTMWIKGREVWSKRGVAVSTMSELKHGLYHGELFTHGIVAIVPHDERHGAAILAYVDEAEFRRNVRLLDQKVSVARGTFENLPFDLSRWEEVAARRYPQGLPEPESDDPTQWLFHGRPEASTAPLQVAVARLLGYRSPPELDGAIRLSSSGARASRAMRGVAASLGRGRHRLHAVCAWRAPAAERLRALLAAAFGDEWSPAKEADLLAEVGYAGKSLEQWLRDGFFEQHCQLFHQRPFVWQIWDGRKDGFSALVNYHRLDRANLEKLTYTYLGDWIRAAARGGSRRHGGSRPSPRRRAGAAEEARADPRGRGAVRHLRSLEAARGAAARLGA